MSNPDLYFGRILDGFRALRIALIAIMFSSIGCVKRQVQGQTLTYSPEPWVIALVALVPIVAVIGGWFLRRVRKGVGYLIIAGGVLVLGTTVPGLSLSKTIVDSDHFEWRRGLKHTSIRFDDLADMFIQRNVSRLRGPNQTSTTSISRRSQVRSFMSRSNQPPTVSSLMQPRRSFAEPN
jgi:hypothetical protein